jgi:HemY protein
MIRTLIFTLCVVAVAIGVAWLRPGTITVAWLGYQVETSTLLGALTIAVLILQWGLMRYLFRI